MKGDAWDAALEQRLFVETLLDVFEGERARARVVIAWPAVEAESLPVGSGDWRRSARVGFSRGVLLLLSFCGGWSLFSIVVSGSWGAWSEGLSGSSVVLGWSLGGRES